MSDVVVLSDQNILVPTEKFELAKFSFSHFNPVQSRVFEIYKEPANLVVAAATSSGKTAVAEMLLAYEIKQNKTKGIYVSPSKALAQEKIDDWTSKEHHFNDLNTEILTGDYRLTPDRVSGLNNADLVLKTIEMLNSKLRNIKDDKISYLHETGCLVIDESHKIGVGNASGNNSGNDRGAKLEIAIMKMAEVNPNCRIVALSATLPNVEEFAAWLSELTKRKTYVIVSKYRPCPLFTHYIPYDDSSWNYQAKEMAKIYTAIDLIRDHSQDKFLVFFHGKKTGQLMLDELERIGIQSGFHNANLTKEKRIKLENDFKTNPNFRVLLATSTMAEGLNTPARRVIVLGIHRGMSEVEAFDIVQETGRAGRPQYDKQGDAYVLVPNKNMHKHVKRLQTLDPIRSQLIPKDDKSYHTLAFHVISEIYNKNITNKEKLYKWYHNTFAYFQNKDLDDKFIDNMLDCMFRFGIIKDLGDGEFEATNMGKIASLFYFSPFDVVDYRKNFSSMFENGMEKDDICIALCLANINSYQFGIVSKDEQEQIEGFMSKAQTQKYLSVFKKIPDHVAKIAFCYNSMLNGFSNSVFTGVMSGLRNDMERVLEVIGAIDNMASKWNQSKYIRQLSKRLSYGVNWNLLDLCEIKGIGKVKAKKLWDAGIKSKSEFIAKQKLAQLTLKCSDTFLNEVVGSLSD